MKVLHIGAVCGHGGTETVMATLIREQRRLGIDAEAYYFINRGGAEIYDGVCRIRLAEEHSLTNVLLREDFDLIHVVSGAAPNAQTCLKRALYRGPVVVSCHGTFRGCMGSKYVTAVSNYTAKSIQSECPAEVTVVNNGVDTSLFFPGEAEGLDRPIVAWVGRTDDPLKDSDGFIALANSGKADDFQLVVVDGSPSDYDYERWLPKDTLVFRRKPWCEMPDFYRWVRASMGVVISTSRMESFGLSVVEAQACGCPVVAPSVGGMAEIMKDRSTGFYYERNAGVDGLTQGIRWIYEGDNYARVSSNALEFVKSDLSARRMCEGYSRVYEQAVTERKHAKANPMARMLVSMGASTIDRSRRLLGKSRTRQDNG